MTDEELFAKYFRTSASEKFDDLLKKAVENLQTFSSEESALTLRELKAIAFGMKAGAELHGACIKITADFPLLQEGAAPRLRGLEKGISNIISPLLEQFAATVSLDLLETLELNNMKGESDND